MSGRRTVNNKTVLIEAYLASVGNNLTSTGSLNTVMTDRTSRQPQR